MIVICFDGSKDARAAIERASELYPSQPATVVTVWEPMMEVWARATPGFGLVPSVPNAEELEPGWKTWPGAGLVIGAPAGGPTFALLGDVRAAPA